MTPPLPTIAYIIKGFPRHSEAFITHEIQELEALGLRFSIVSAFRGDPAPSSVAHNLQSPVTYLPEDPASIDRSFWRWLIANLPRYGPSHMHLLLRRPGSYVKTACEALYLSFSLRKSFGLRPKKVVYKDFLRSGVMALHVVRSGTIAHLHAHFCHGATTMAMFTSRLTGVPFSFTAHAKDIYVPKLNPGNLLSLKFARARFVATCTDFNRHHLAERYPTHAAKIHRVYHGVNTQRFTPHSGRPHSMPVILSVGRHVNKKGFPYLLEAYGMLRERGHTFQGIILGEFDEETPRLRALITALHLEDTVILKPGVPQDELREVYPLAAIFALACHVVDDGDRDGIPNVLAEAMACGVPVVSTDVSGIPELIEHQRHGLLVPQKTSHALADALERLLIDHELRAALGCAGRHRILSMFDARSNITKLSTLFRDAISQHGGCRPKEDNALSTDTCDVGLRRAGFAAPGPACHASHTAPRPHTERLSVRS